MPKISNIRELRNQRFEMMNEQEALIARAESDNRDLTTGETKVFDLTQKKIRLLDSEIHSAESVAGTLPLPGRFLDGGMPGILSIPLGDSETSSLAAWMRSGDEGAVRSLLSKTRGGNEVRIAMPRGLPGAGSAEQRAAVDSTMNITTAEDGGASVPTGFSRTIALRRNEIRLAERLGIRMVPGKGTTVNYPYESSDPTQFAATAEQDDAHAQNYERDVGPVMANKPFTLDKYTKKLELTEELLDDEDVNLMAHVADCIGRAIGITHNILLITEVAANGTKLKDFAGASAIAAGEPEDVLFNDTLGAYLDDASPGDWVCRHSTFGMIASLTGDARLYAQTPGGSFQKELLGYKVSRSNAVAAPAASAKSLFFGNWFYVGMREDPSLRIIRDPYTVDGLVILKYSFRTVYGVLIAGAIGYAQHPTG